jgi:lysophospholipase L1-like esterase
MGRVTAAPRPTPWLLALVAIGVTALLGELALRALSPVPDPYQREWATPNAVNAYIRLEYPRRYSAVTEAEPGLPGVSGRHRFTTNNVGLRGDSLAVPKPADEYRVFAVGGSTTECFYLDDEEALPRVIERELASQRAGGRRIRVYNAGLSGAASDDHLAMIGQRLVHLEPDLIVVLAGINDLRRGIAGFDYLHFDVYGPEDWVPAYQRWMMKSQILRRLHYLRVKIDPDPTRIQEQRMLKSTYARRIRLQNATPESDAVPRVDTQSYATNLASVAGIARAHGFRLVFVTQPTSWNSTIDPGARAWHWMRHYQGVTYREAAMDAALEQMNDVMRGFAAGDSTLVYDLAREMPRSLEYFYDDCHFNAAGAAWVGRRLAAFLAGSLQFAPAQPAAAGTADSPARR